MKIGVFDSGIGGLTVLRQLRQAFPNPDMIYLGDLARVPYGGRSVETITRYARDDVDFLLSQQVDAIVVACGTVSSNSLDVLKKIYNIPIYGVIESAAKQAAKLTKTKNVGVIGTTATVKSGAYERVIHQVDADVTVRAQNCPLFVPLVENGIGHGDPIAELVVDRYLSTFDNTETDVLIMGCTHYPVLRTLLEERMPQCTMIDVGHALASTLPFANEGNGTTQYYVTERSAAFNEIVKIMDPLINPQDIQIANIE